MTIELAFAKLQFGLKQRGAMYRKIISFARQGTPIFNTIEKFALAYGEKRGDPRTVILNDWADRMRDGSTFSQAIQGYCPEAEQMLIAAGEAQGDLGAGIERALFVTESQSAIKTTIISGLAYGVILFLVLMGMMFLFATQVIPQLVQLMPPEKWAGAAQLLYSMSVFVRDYGAMTLGVSVFALVAILKTLGSFRGRLRMALDVLPPWSIHRAMQSSVFLITLSSMMSAGVPVKNALTVIQDKASPYLNWFILQIVENMSHGMGNGDAMDVGLMDKDTAIDIKLFGQSGDFVAAMMMVGRMSVETAVTNIKGATAIISNVLLFLTAGYTGFVYYGFYTLTSAISQAAR